MAPTFYEEQEKLTHTHFQGTLGDCGCRKETVGSNMPFTGLESFSDNYKQEKPLTETQKAKLWLFNKRQEEIKRGWKKDKYAKVHGQIRI